MEQFINFITENWLAILSLLITIITLIRTHKRIHAIGVHLNLMVDESNSFNEMIKESTDIDSIKKWSASFNHSITCLLSIIPSAAKKWIAVKPEDKWPEWEQKLGVSMWYFRLKCNILKRLNLK